MQKYLYAVVFLFIAAKCIAQNPVAQVGKQPFVLGLVDSVSSAYLKETRVLNIYLPEGYSPDSATLYPVVYLLDGSADEDFIHIAGLVQFCNFSWVNILPKSIVVGIANVDRRRDFTFPTSVVQDKKDYPSCGASGNFISFIEKELQPYIERQYKANKDRMLIGQSLGGLLATEILFTRPALFRQYVIISPSLWWNNESLLKKKLPTVSSTVKDVYVGVGNEGKIMTDDAKALFVRLQRQQAINSSFRYFADEDHATIFHEAVYRAFQQLAGKKKPVEK
jgi:hypothetical protein